MRGELDLCGFSVFPSTHEDIHDIKIIDSASLLSGVNESWFIGRQETYPMMFFVAKLHHSNRVVGYFTAADAGAIGYYNESLPGFVYLSRFAVSEGLRRCGIGTGLYNTMIDSIMRMPQRYRGVVGDVRKSNRDSLSFFGSKGFREYEELSRPHWYNNGRTDDDRHKIVMYKLFPGR